MSTHNIILAEVVCPRCGGVVREIEGFVGLGELREYRIGDRIQWAPRKSPQHAGRPPDGNVDAEGYGVCPRCGKDFFLVLRVRNDVLESVAPDPSKPGYIS